jgi:hypothetical protein
VKIDITFGATSLTSSIEGDVDIKVRTSSPSGEMLDIEMTKPRAKLSRENAKLLGLALLEWADR